MIFRTSHCGSHVVVSRRVHPRNPTSIAKMAIFKRVHLDKPSFWGPPAVSFWGCTFKWPLKQSNHPTPIEDSWPPQRQQLRNLLANVCMFLSGDLWLVNLPPQTKKALWSGLMKTHWFPLIGPHSPNHDHKYISHICQYKALSTPYEHTYVQWWKYMCNDQTQYLGYFVSFPCPSLSCDRRLCHNGFAWVWKVLLACTT